MAGVTKAVMRLCCLLAVTIPLTSAVTSLQNMETAIIGLDTKMRVVANKLHRHEARSRQVSEVTTKNLRAIVTQTAGQSRNVQSIAVYMAKMESRLIKMEKAMQKTDRKMANILDQLKTQSERCDQPQETAAAAAAPEVMAKLDIMDEEINDRLNGLLSETTTSRETVTSHLQRQDTMVNDLSNSMGTVSGFSTSIQQSSERLAEVEAQLGKHVEDAEKVLTEFSVGVGVLIDNAHHLGNDSLRLADDVSLIRGDLQKMEGNMDARQVELFNSQYQTSQTEQLTDQVQLQLETAANTTADQLTALRTEVDTLVGARAAEAAAQAERLLAGQVQLTDMVQESMAMSEGLFERVNRGYRDLNSEIEGLSNLEAVMVDTADSVLDTKRRLEYGVQQILLEVEAAVKAQGIKINGTFSSKFGNISQEILANQSMALHNMTKSIEGEIAQVWRQIGVMYQTLSTSAQVLDKIDDKTTLYVNGTIDSTDKVDGTVGDVAKRVGEVEENLNFLLGRLSLVVSEFNHMKSGIGAELDLLRTKFHEFGPGGEPLAAAGVGPPDTDDEPRKVPI